MNPIKLILLFSTLLVISCNNNQKPTTDTSDMTSSEGYEDVLHVTQAQFESANMNLGKLVEKPFSISVHTNGVIDVPPQNRAVISAFSGGYIKNTPLLIGDEVKKGDRLVTIENPEFITLQQQYMETSEQLSYLKSEYERQKTMFEENITSQKNYLKAESDYKTAVSRVNSLKKNLQMLNINPAAVLEGKIVSQVNIYSPIDGYITNVFVNTGTYVSPADQILEIMNTKHIHLELKVFEKDLLHIKKGQEIIFKIPEASDQQFIGDVHLVGTTIDAQSRIAMIHGHIDHRNEANFSVGMFVEAEIITGKTTEWALPEDAVVELEGKNYVLVLEEKEADGYHFHPVEVKLKSNYNGFTSFETDLNHDTQFLIKGGFNILQSEDSGGHGH